MVWFTWEKKIFCVQINKSGRLLDVYGEYLQKEHMFVPRKFRNSKTYVTSQEELNIARKNDLSNVQSFNVWKLRKNNLLENIAN